MDDRDLSKVNPQEGYGEYEYSQTPDDVRRGMPIEIEQVEEYLRNQDLTKNEYIAEKLRYYFQYSLDKRAWLDNAGQSWKSWDVSPMTYMFVNRIYSSIKDIGWDYFVESLLEYKKSDEKQRFKVPDEMRHLMYAILQQNNSTDAVRDAIHDCLLFGWGIWKNTYYKQEKKRSVKKYKTLTDEEAKTNTGKEYEDITRKKDSPAIEYVSPFNLYFDPNATSIDNSRFVIHRSVKTAKGLQKYLASFGIDQEIEFLLGLEVTRDFIINYDYDTIKNNLVMLRNFVESFTYNQTSFNMSGAYNNLDKDTLYNIRDGLMEVIEIHTKDKIYFYANKQYLGECDSVCPRDGFQYQVIHYNKNAGNLYSIGIGHVVMPLQKNYDFLVNSRLDNVKLAMNKVFIRKGTLGNLGMKNSGTIQLSPGKVIDATDDSTIEELPISEIKQSAYAEADSQFSLMQSATGVNTMQLGLQQKVERVAGAVSMLESAQTAQLTPFLQSLNNALSEMFKRSMIMAKLNMDDDSIEKVLGTGSAFSKITLKEIMDDFSYGFTLDNLSQKLDATKKQQLITTIQILQQFRDEFGKPEFDIKPLVEKLVESFQEYGDVSMSDEKYFSEQTKTKLIAAEEEAKLQKELQKKGVAPPTPAGEQEKQQAQPTNPLEEMRKLQGTGAGTVPPEMTTNAQGAN